MVKLCDSTNDRKFVLINIQFNSKCIYLFSSVKHIGSQLQITFHAKKGDMAFRSACEPSFGHLFILWKE